MPHTNNSRKKRPPGSLPRPTQQVSRGSSKQVKSVFLGSLASQPPPPKASPNYPAPELWKARIKQKKLTKIQPKQSPARIPPIDVDEVDHPSWKATRSLTVKLALTEWKGSHVIFDDDESL